MNSISNNIIKAVDIFIQLNVKSIKSVIPDLATFNKYELFFTFIFGCISIVFSIVDFNYFYDPYNYPFVLQWDNQELYGIPRWKRIICTTSGIISFTGVLSVVLTTKMKYSLYFWGVINSLAFGIFAMAYGYGGDAQMNIIVFFPSQYIGMYYWDEEMLPSSGDLQVKKLTLQQFLSIVCFGIGITAAFYYEIPEFTAAILGYYPYGVNSAPKMLDTVSNACNLIGQILLLHGYWEQWIFWVCVDCMQISMFAGISGFGININILIMWCLFLINALFGLVFWFKAAYMKPKNTGLTVGKFYPFHSGHKYLIDTALLTCTKVYVIVCWIEGQSPSGACRIEWIKETYKNDKRVVVCEYKYDDTVDQNDSELWANICKNVVNETIDTAFTSEDYGEAFCKYLQARHVLVDLSRKTVPISGTKLRANPGKYLDYLPPVVRGYYNKKIVIVGAESTGKTTLCEKLAKHYNTTWVSEYGRELTIKKYDAGDTTWNVSDFVTVATTQTKIENELLMKASKYLFCDTDAFATSIWCWRYLGEWSKEVEDVYKNVMRPADLYILMDVNTSFVQDGYRDGEAIRGDMHQQFIEQLKAHGYPWVLITGDDYEVKFNQVINQIDQKFEGDNMNIV